MNTYHRLSFSEREEISRGLATGQSLRTIARRLGRSPSTISRELPNGVSRWGYRAFFALRRSFRCQKRHAVRKIDRFPGLRRYVFSKLRLQWSPEQIVNSLKKEYPADTTMQISHESIYTYLYVLPKGELKKELLSCLRQGQKRRRRRGQVEPLPAKIKDMIGIDKRPRAVANRTVPGHWEGDILLGKERRSYLGTLVERTTRFVLLVPLTSKKAPFVRQAFVRIVKRIPLAVRRSMTYDQGYEMAQHRLFTHETQMKVYFAHVSSPWERGTNENTNGLLRQFFPKGTDFSTVSSSRIKKVQLLLNDRPRKVLHWETPSEVFSKLLR